MVLTVLCASTDFSNSLVKERKLATDHIHIVQLGALKSATLFRCTRRAAKCALQSQHLQNDRKEVSSISVYIDWFLWLSQANSGYDYINRQQTPWSHA